MSITRLPPDFYRRDARIVARGLLGCVLGSHIDGGTVRGLIIETEAYLGAGDPASHSACGRTARNSAMFLPGGHAYVYRIYGIHHCFNVVTGIEDTGEAVLVRAVAPIDGIELMRIRRGGAPGREKDLSNGPGKLAVALGIGMQLNGADLTADDRIWIEPGREIAETEVSTTPRIGISKATERLWRWVATGRGGDGTTRRGDDRTTR